MFKGDFSAQFCECLSNGQGSEKLTTLLVGKNMQMATSRALYEYWNTLRGARSAPDRRDIDPTKIRNALASTFILELNEDEKFNFRLAGSHICSAYCRELKGRSFSELWHDKDRDAIDTLVRAVTEDHAVALVSFSGSTSVGTSASFETILLPLRHNGSTDSRMLGAITALDEPYWLGTQPIIEQRITGLRLIWPDDPSMRDEARDIATSVMEMGANEMRGTGHVPMTVQMHGNSARRYAHLAVIDGGRQ